MKRFYVSLIVLGVFLSACNKEDDAPVVDETIEEEEVVQEGPANLLSDYPTQNFMWQAMNAYYFWQEDVPDLADSKFSDVPTSQDYIDFLAAEEDAEAFFYKICNNHERVVGEANAVDRFSFASDNYEDLVNSLQGVSRSNGLEFQLYLFQGSDDIYGVVTYVALNSDAATKEIERGDVFIAVDGQRLNRANFFNLLFGENSTYTLGMAEITNNTITENNQEVTLTKVENFSENPILVSKVIEQSGVKIGYLMYNGFLAAFDEELNTVFADFKSEGVQELVLDFRYNGGGRVSSAVQIASSVYGTNTTDLFLKARYNNKIQSQFNPGDGETNFTDTTIDGSPINALNLQRVYIIATDRTASASELVINGLEPYVDVVQIGTATTGKNEFSITFVDDIQNGYFYDPNRQSNINPNNQWGIQPLLGRNENADGFSDYTSGLIPDFELEEDISNLGVLGDPSEPLLALAINRIMGTGAKTDFTPSMTAKSIYASYDIKRSTNLSLMDGLLRLDIQKRK